MSALVRRLVFAVLVASVPVTGCTTTESRVTTERYDEPRARYGDPVVEQSRTTVVEVDSDHHNGVFGIIGDIIALPFRAVGALLDAIF